MSIRAVAFVEEGEPHAPPHQPTPPDGPTSRRRLSPCLSTCCPSGTTSDYDDVDFSAPEAQRRSAQVGALNAELERAGAWVFGAGLHPASSATVVRADGGDVSMTDGPYAETKEQMGGFWIIEAADLDAALDWAAQGRRPPARDRSRSDPRRVPDPTSTAVFRREAGRCTATLIRVLGDIDLAEDAVAEAFAIAAEQWPVDGRAAEPRRLDHHHRPQPRHRPAATRIDPHRPPPRRPPTPRPTTWNPTTTPSSTTSTTSSTSSPTTSSG